MNKVGDFLTLIKEIESKNSYPLHTFDKKYQIMYISQNEEIYYLTHDRTPQYIEKINKRKDLTKEQKYKKIKNECSLWTQNQIEEYFINIRDQRKQKLDKLKRAIERN